MERNVEKKKTIFTFFGVTQNTLYLVYFWLGLGPKCWFSHQAKFLRSRFWRCSYFLNIYIFYKYFFSVTFFFYFEIFYLEMKNCLFFLIFFFSQFFVCLFLDILSQILKWHAFFYFPQSFLQNFVFEFGIFFLTRIIFLINGTRI